MTHTKQIKINRNNRTVYLKRKDSQAVEKAYDIMDRNRSYVGVNFFEKELQKVIDLKINFSELERKLFLKSLRQSAEYIYSQIKNNEFEYNVLSEFNHINIKPFDIEEIPKKYDSLIFLRQSIKNDSYKNRYNFMEKTLTKHANKNANTPFTVFYKDLSGYWSYKYIYEYLQLEHIKSIYVSEISRLSRNIEGYIFITQYAYENNKEIYLNETLITEGKGYIAGLVLAIFAEFDLLSKQNKFSYYLNEVALFLKREITFKEIENPKAKKLCKLARYTDRTEFLNKMNDKALETLEDKEKSEELKEVAKEVLEIING